MRTGVLTIDYFLHAAFPFAQIQQEVADLIKDKVVVGHGLKNDFKVSVPLHSCLSTVFYCHTTRHAPTTRT
jgi:DNA polymerase III epsilon subunit-like protein